MSREFPKVYTPAEIEKKWYDIWQNNKIYQTNTNSSKPAYSILMPPPNVTGVLHFGHVLNNTLQDVYIRRKRMQGNEVCWFPGYDHAGIATQSRVEAELRKVQLSRYDLGRDKFIEKVWEWKENYGGIILKQLRTLGISCDWDRLLYTMDESASNAVREVFIKLFDEGLIYKGKRIINWSPLGRTALSDEEVEFREVQEHLYTLRYKFTWDDGYLCVATVRPETIFGDVAVAVNPNDERYINLIGKKVIAPLSNREIEIIADDYADPAFGTGCVKITPAHDPNDYEVGLRHSLEMPNSIEPDGTLNSLAGEFAGMERFDARKKIVAKLKECELIEKIEEYNHNVGFSQRGGEPVEPYLSDQWFVIMKPLAELALKPVLDGEIRFYPNHWVKTYEHWMNNIRDWCISRQLWWGHRIPVYYSADGRFTAARSEEDARNKLGIISGEKLIQDEDVLDTWFSSWLWPLTTMNWLADGENENSAELSRFLPTSLMVTAPDIIFFWVARMIMASLKFKNTIPFRDVYFTSMIRDGLGRKLSKSLGNSPDPLNVIDKYGTDAVRFTMLYLSPLGQDVKMDVNVETQDIPSMEIGRNFANKIWNAGRFLLMKYDSLDNKPSETDIPDTIYLFDSLSYADKWILSRFNSTLEKIEHALANFKVNDYSKILYDFIWRDFCDWYIEIFKVEFNEIESGRQKSDLMQFALSIFMGIMKLLHPIMPFISEEIWHLLTGKSENESISLTNLPLADSSLVSSEIEDNFELLQLIVEEIRRLRANSNIAPSVKLPVSLSVQNQEKEKFFTAQASLIGFLARCSDVKVSENQIKPAQSLNSVVREVELFLEIGSAIDLDKEKERLTKEIERLERNIIGSRQKLSNERFVANAPADIVEFERKKLSDMLASLALVQTNLESL